MYYPSLQIDPVRNAVSSSEQTSLQRSSLPTQRAQRTDRHTERVCVYVCVCVRMCVLTQTHTHTQCGAGGQRTVPKLPALLLLPPTCQLLCDLPLQSTVVLMCSVHGTSLSLCVSLASHSPSLTLPVPFSRPLPHCLQLHLFPSMWQMIAGLFFPLHATVLLLVLSLCSLSLPLSLGPFSPSQPPTMPFFFSPPAHCQLLVPAQAPS